MPGFGLDADQDRGVTSLGSLQGGGKLERMAGHNPVIVIGCGDQRGRGGTLLRRHSRPADNLRDRESFLRSNSQVNGRGAEAGGEHRKRGENGSHKEGVIGRFRAGIALGDSSAAA